MTQVLFQLIVSMIMEVSIRLPKFVPHPVEVMGYAIKLLDTTINNGSNRRLKGVAAVVILIAVTLYCSHIIQFQFLEPFISAFILWIFLCQNSLIQHVKDVVDKLSHNNIDAARQSISMIVGRDTHEMNQSDISRSAIESLSEGFLDGIISPIFWFLIADVYGLMVYKMINTADSMIGNMSLRHKDFGWCAAHVDDIMNYIPARISAVIIAIAGGRPIKSMWIALKDAHLQRSPNAGWPISAISVPLNIALSGIKSYQGTLANDPVINRLCTPQANTSHIIHAISIINRSWYMIMFIAVLSLTLQII